MIYKCVKKGDERAVVLLKDYKRFEDEPRRPVEKAVKTRFEEPIVLDESVTSVESRPLESERPISEIVGEDPTLKDEAIGTSSGTGPQVEAKREL